MTIFAAPTFLRRSPLRQARRYAHGELTGKAKTSEIQWLYANPVMWLAALHRIQRDVEAAIAAGRLQLAPLKPLPGVAASSEYLSAKVEFEISSQRRVALLAAVASRVDDVKAICGPRRVADQLAIGDLVDVFVSIADSADSGDLESAADKAMWWAKRLSAEARSDGAP